MNTKIYHLRYQAYLIVEVSIAFNSRWIGFAGRFQCCFWPKKEYPRIIKSSRRISFPTYLGMYRANQPKNNLILICSPNSCGHCMIKTEKLERFEKFPKRAISGTIRATEYSRESHRTKVTATDAYFRITSLSFSSSFLSYFRCLHDAIYSEGYLCRKTIKDAHISTWCIISFHH